MRQRTEKIGEALQGYQDDDLVHARYRAARARLNAQRELSPLDACRVGMFSIKRPGPDLITSPEEVDAKGGQLTAFVTYHLQLAPGDCRKLINREP
jgi:hypothetical protein